MKQIPTTVAIIFMAILASCAQEIQLSNDAVGTAVPTTIIEAAPTVQTPPPTASIITPTTTVSETAVPETNRFPLDLLALKATPTQSPKATAASNLEADLLEGLILSSPRDFAVVSIIKDNAPVSLTKYEAGRLANGKWFGYATVDEKVYTAQNGQIIEFSAAGHTQIPFARIPQSIYGIVNDWLILSSFPLDWTVQQEVGNLTAVSLSTLETLIISDDRPPVTPIVAPDGSEVIYWANDAALSWRGEEMQFEKRPFPQFRSGAISLNGEFVALLLSGEIHIYDLQTNQLVYQEAFANCPGDGFCFPVWHPNNRQVAYGAYIAEQVPPFALRLIALDGPVQQFDGVGFPAFSPDGEWMAVYRNIRNMPETAVVHLKTGEILNTPFSGIPINWTDSQGLDSYQMD